MFPCEAHPGLYPIRKTGNVSRATHAHAQAKQFRILEGFVALVLLGALIAVRYSELKPVWTDLTRSLPEISRQVSRMWRW
jgi:hypothetical protein